jgi:hypothetical protein
MILYRFVPVSRGDNNLDCFRIYEAAAMGAIPVIVGLALFCTFLFDNIVIPIYDYFLYLRSAKEILLCVILSSTLDRYDKASYLTF